MDATEQRPIHFGGVQLPELQASVGNRVTFQSTHNVEPVLGSGPCGEATRDARAVQLSRIALAARIKQGVPMSELTAHFVTLSIAEGVLLSE